MLEEYGKGRCIFKPCADGVREALTYQFHVLYARLLGVSRRGTRGSSSALRHEPTIFEGGNNYGVRCPITVNSMLVHGERVPTIELFNIMYIVRCNLFLFVPPGTLHHGAFLLRGCSFPKLAKRYMLQGRRCQQRN